MSDFLKLGDTLKGVSFPAQKNSKTASDSPTPEPEYTCDLCKDKGWLKTWVDDTHADVVRCPCKAESDRIEMEHRFFRLCALPAGTVDMTFENFRRGPGLEDAYKAAVDLAGEGEVRRLTLSGGVDRGKTHLAVAICRHWLAQRRPARYVYAPLLLDELRAGYESDDFNLKWHFFLNVPLLVLDDLGVERLTDWAMERLDTLFDYRLMHDLRMVVTTNLRMTDLPPRIASRMQRDEGRVIVVGGEEYRLRRHGQ